ncbi:MAG: hypothetical protein ACYDAC_06740 [Candidatus Dormibacteria bacterium]
MAISPTTLIRGSLPAARTALALAREGHVRDLLRLADGAIREVGATPGMPAAVRIERARSTGGGGSSEQTAVTLWFGQGPSLPSPGGPTVRSAARIGAGVVGAVALAALTAVAARREEQRAPYER